ncbi:MAG: NAD-dependent epimerase/dehydratase family protein [Planctomycetes bacterium]|nr:NAD-dependent epimerase/dehydratase family protein [Planctomycetota bacterium]
MSSSFRVGLLGAGYIADWHCKALQSVPGAQVVAVCDQSAERAAILARRCGAEQTHTSLEAMLATGPLDAVHVLLPPAAHLDAARILHQHGVAAYIEKPFGVSADECQQLADLEGANNKLAIGHNFLFTPGYEQFKADLAAGRLGRIEHITVIWAKEFGQLRAGPFGAWVFRQPGNIMLEVGPHIAAHMLDLAGVPDRVQAEALDPILLPNGVKFYRRWLIRSFHGRVCVDALASFGPGFSEHRVEVRGSAGTATIDFEAGTYILRRRTHLPPDLDRYVRTRREARTTLRQARGTLARYAFSKVGLTRDGNLFGMSISRAIRRFYADLPHVSDPRLTAKFATSVVRTCHDIIQAAGLASTEATPIRTAHPVAILPASSPEVLILGGTGFIGRALVRRMVSAGRRIRLLARDPNSVPAELRQAGVEVAQGDLSRSADLTRALEGVPAVVHLARSQSRTWSEYLRDDVGVTRAVGEACLAASVRRLVYTGTTDSYYSGRDEVITEATPLDPMIHRRNLYARAKVEAERVLYALQRERGLPVVVARPAIVIGPGGDPHHWGIGSWASPDTCRLWGDGTNAVPLILADDVAAALIRCLDVEGIEGESFNLAADASVTPREYLAAMSEALGTWIDVQPSSPLRFYTGDMGKWVVKRLIRHPERRFPSYRDWKSRTYRARYDCSKAKRILGWAPVSDREVLLTEGVRRAAIEWCS